MQKVYDSGEAGMECIPESYRAGIGLVIREIRRRDRAAQGITQEQELQAERAVMKSYLIGSVTVVDMHDAKPLPYLTVLLRLRNMVFLCFRQTEAAIS